VLLLDPMYGEYRHVLETVVKCNVDSIIARADEGFRIDQRELAQYLERGYDAVVLVNPNSPTGVLFPSSTLADLISHFPNTRFWIDETYIEYCGASHSLEKFAAASQNAFVCKSMSKVYALSGLRSAYLVGPAEGVASLSFQFPPWAVSLPAQVAAVAALKEDEYYAKQYRMTAELREHLVAELEAQCGIISFPSVTNCLLCRLPASAPHADEIVRRARMHNLFIRSGARIHESLGSGVIRIAVKSQALNERAISVLRQVLLHNR
jgi:histidinol-phosphate/aromatic aminotransferase/cobyric acid decarboxylase-like protein